ncbi:hypothetical protein BKA81DRAFT_232561 [Phyllosticta paracitricarpa]
MCCPAACASRHLKPAAIGDEVGTRAVLLVVSDQQVLARRLLPPPRRCAFFPWSFPAVPQPLPQAQNRFFVRVANLVDFPPPAHVDQIFSRRIRSLAPASNHFLIGLAPPACWVANGYVETLKPVLKSQTRAREGREACLVPMDAAASSRASPSVVGMLGVYPRMIS